MEVRKVVVPATQLLLLLVLLLVQIDASSSNPAWHESVNTQLRVHHQLTADECYHYTNRTHSTVITALLPDEQLSGKRKLFVSTFKNLLKNNPADVIFFNPHGWPQTSIDSLKQSMGVPHLRVLCIAQEDWARQHRDKPWEYVMRDYHGPGYRSMCNWYSSRMFQVLYRAGYEWVIRIDTDSSFPDPVPYNLASAMQETGAVYGFRAISTEPPAVVGSLPEAARYWLMAEDMEPTFIHKFCNPQSVAGLATKGYSATLGQGDRIKGWNQTIIYNNFFITKLSWWMQPKVRAWLSHLEHLRGFYKHRWGDAPVHTFTLGMFLPETQMLEFGFIYEHQGGFAEQAYATSWPHYHKVLAAPAANTSAEPPGHHRL